MAGGNQRLAEVLAGRLGPAVRLRSPVRAIEHDHEGVRVLTAGGAALRPELSMDLDRALLTTWNDDPWAGESYSAHTTGVADGDDQLIASPAGRVHFAGEHTAGAWAGLMEGALRSGARAADEVLATARRS